MHACMYIKTTVLMKLFIKFLKLENLCFILKRRKKLSKFKIRNTVLAMNKDKILINCSKS